MTRKSEIARAIIRRRWPHRVELPAESLRGAVNSTAMYGLAKELSCALPPQHMTRDGHELVPIA